MPRIITLLVSLVFISVAQAQQLPQRQEQGSLVLEGVPAHDAALAERLAPYLDSRNAEFLDWLSDTSLLVATRFGETEQIHRVAAPLGMREQLTFYSQSIDTARVPQVTNAEGFVFLKEPPSESNPQLYYYRNTDRSVRLLSDGKSLNGGPVWSHDGRRLAFFSNSRSGAGYDIYITEVAGATAPRLVIGAQNDKWYPLDWSADDQKLLVQRYGPGGESDLSVVDAWSGIVTPVDTGNRSTTVRAARFAPDGHGLILASASVGEFTQLRYINPTTHEVRPLLAERNGDVTAFDTSSDGHYLAYVRNEDGHSHLSVLDNQTKAELSPPNVPDGRIGGLRFDRTGKKLAFSAESPQTPRDAYVYDPGRNILERWTQSEIGPLPPDRFVAPEVIHYPTWDRRTQPAFLYRPKTPGPHAVLIDLHGAQSQHQAAFEPFYQFLASELGVAVIVASVRDDAMKDIGSLLVWTGVQPAFNRQRIFVMGDSYGGYLALTALGAFGDRIYGGIDLIGGDKINPPFDKLAAIRRPALLVHGFNDPHAPVAQSRQIVSVLHAKGAEVWFVASKNDGRGIQDKAGRDACYEIMAMFLQK